MNPDDTKIAVIKELFEMLFSSKSGLSALETKKRPQRHGYNEIIEKKVNPIVKFLDCFWGPIP